MKNTGAVDWPPQVFNDMQQGRITNHELPKNIKGYFDSLPDVYAGSYDTVVLEVQEIEESPIGSAMHPNQKESPHSPTELSAINVADLRNPVKGEPEKYIPAFKDSATKLSDRDYSYEVHTSKPYRHAIHAKKNR